VRAAILAEYSIRAVSGDAPRAVWRQCGIAVGLGWPPPLIHQRQVQCDGWHLSGKIRRKHREKLAKARGKGENGGASGDESVAPVGEIGQSGSGFTRLGRRKSVPGAATTAF
jgi:hypothetical protein